MTDSKTAAEYSAAVFCRIRTIIWGGTMRNKVIAKLGAFLTVFTVFAGSMLPVYAASVDETDSTEESTAAAAEGDEESFLFQLEVDGKDTVNV